MNRWMFFIPLGALVTCAAFLGIRAGQVPTETEIINLYAAAYVTEAGQGARPTDCAASPHPDAAVRLVVQCQHAEGTVMIYYVARRGALIPADQVRLPET